MKKPNKAYILVLCQLSQEASKVIAGDARFRVDVIDLSKYTNNPIRQVAGIIVRSGILIDRHLLDLLPDLKFIIRAGSGIDNIELSELKRRGILLFRNPTASSTAVAEVAFAATLSLTRRIPEAAALSMHQIWDKKRLLGESLSDLSVAIWGAGPVGIACGKLLQQYCREVAYAEWSSVPNELPQRSANQLLSQMDVHIICVPLRSATREMVGETFLRLAADRSPYIVNVARYEVLNVPLVADALLSGQLRGVAIDPIDQAHLHEAVAAFHYHQIPSNLLLLQHIGAQRVDILNNISLWAIQQAKTLLDNNHL